MSQQVCTGHFLRFAVFRSCGVCGYDEAFQVSGEKEWHPLKCQCKDPSVPDGLAPGLTQQQFILVKRKFVGAMIESADA